MPGIHYHLARSTKLPSEVRIWVTGKLGLEPSPGSPPLDSEPVTSGPHQATPFCASEELTGRATCRFWEAELTPFWPLGRQ